MHDGFRQRGDRLRPSGEPATTRTQLRLLRAILRAARHGRPLILFSSRGSLKADLCACILLGFWRARPPVVLVGEMWQPGTGPGPCQRTVTGVLVDGSAATWHEALSRLLDAAAEADRLAAAARDRVRTAFTFDSYVTGILAALDEACAERASQR